MLPPAVVLAQYAATLDFSETSRVDGRATQPLPVVQAPPRQIAIAADASVAPTARLRLRDRRWDFTFAYTPTLSVTDIELGPSYQPPVVVNAGTASLAWHDRVARIVVSESGSYGLESIGYLYATPVAGQPAASPPSQTGGGTPSQPAGQTAGQTPTTVAQNGTSTGGLQQFQYGSSSTNASLTVRAGRRTAVSVAGGYSLSGSLTNNPQASAVYPLQYGPVASATVSYAPSPVDTLLTIASAQETTTPKGVCVPGSAGTSTTAGTFCRQDEPILLLQETVRHRVSHTAAVGANLGISASIYQLNSGSAWGILPTVGVSFTDRIGAAPRDPGGSVEGGSLRLSADLVPTINVFTGSPSNRAQVSATYVEALSRLLTLSFTAGASQTVPVPRPDPSPLTLLSGGLDLRVRATRYISISMGIQGFWQSQQNVGALPTTSTTGTTTSTEVGYIALTARLPTLRL
jgi:hypothetical protein